MIINDVEFNILFFIKKEKKKEIFYELCDILLGNIIFLIVIYFVLKYLILEDINEWVKSVVKNKFL